MEQRTYGQRNDVLTVGNMSTGLTYHNVLLDVVVIITDTRMSV